MELRSAGAAVEPPEVADFQQLIRYVERWRMAHFQRPDSRLKDADELLRKLRRGLTSVAQGGMARMDRMGQLGGGMGGMGPSGPAWLS